MKIDKTGTILRPGRRDAGDEERYTTSKGGLERLHCCSGNRNVWAAIEQLFDFTYTTSVLRGQRGETCLEQYKT